MRSIDLGRHWLLRTKLFGGSDAGLTTTSSTSDLANATSYFTQESSPFDEQQDEEILKEDFLAPNGVC